MQMRRGKCELDAMHKRKQRVESRVRNRKKIIGKVIVAARRKSEDRWAWCNTRNCKML